MTRLSDLLSYLDSCSDRQFLEFCDAMGKRGYQFVPQYVLDYDYPHVTHCKDCRNYRPHEISKGLPYCEWSGALTSDDDFCNHAKRKEAENETDTDKET